MTGSNAGDLALLGAARAIAPVLGFFGIGAQLSDLDKLSGRTDYLRDHCKPREWSPSMITRFHLLRLAATSAASVLVGMPAFAQSTIKIGELNSYKAQPAFLDLYKKGWEFAIEEINAKGGVLGKKLEVVSRDDGANPGDAVRVANELATREGSTSSPAPSSPISGSPSPNSPARRRCSSSPPSLDRQDHLAERQPLHVPPAPLDLHAGGDADPTRGGCQQEALGGDLSQLRIRPVGRLVVQGDAQEGAARRGIRHRAGPPLGRVDAGTVVQAIDDAKPDGVFNVLFGPDLAKLVREGTTRGTFKNRTVVSLLSGEPEYLDPLKDEAPVGWIVTGYPWDAIDTPAHKAFLAAYQKRWNDYPRLGSDRRLRHDELAGCRHRQGGLDRYREADHRVPRAEGRRPFGPFNIAPSTTRRRSRLCRKDRGQERQGHDVGLQYVDGASVLPSDEEEEAAPGGGDELIAGDSAGWQGACRVRAASDVAARLCPPRNGESGR